MSTIAEKEIASQMVLEEEGAQNREMMLRAPEAARKIARSPLTRQHKTQEGVVTSKRTR